MAMKFNNRMGFTVFEMLIVLAITAGILLLSLMAIISFQSNGEVEEKAFFNALDAEWKRAQYDAKYLHHSTLITFSPGQPIRFLNNGVKRFLTTPKNIRVTQQRVIKMSQDGNVQPQTITFDSKVGRDVKMIIQMGWGVYRLEKSAT